MASSLSIVARNFAAIAGGDALGRLIAFAATIYIGNVLGAEGLGVVTIAVSVTLYLSQFADFGIDTMGNAEVAKDPSIIQTEAPYIMSARIAFGAVLAVVVGAVSVFLIGPPEGVIIGAMVLRVIFTSASTKWIHIGLENALPVGITRIIGETLMLGLVLALVRGLGDLWVVPVAQVSGEAVVAIGLLVMLARRGHKIPVKWSVEKVKPVVKRAWPVVAHSLLGLFIFNSDQFFLWVLRDVESVGYYGAAYHLMSFLLNVGMAYALSLIPTLARLEDRSDAERGLYQTATSQVYAVVLPTAVGGMLLSGAIVALVYGDGFGPSVMPMQVLIWSVFLTLYRSVAIAGLLARSRQDLLLKTTTWAAVGNVVLNAILIPPLGIVGAAIATLVTELVRTILAFRYSKSCDLPSPPLARYWRATVACVAMGGAVWFAGIDNLFIGLPVGIAVYAVALVIVGGIKFENGRPTLAV